MPVRLTIHNLGGWLDVPDASVQHDVQIQRFDFLHGGPNQQWGLIPAGIHDHHTLYQIVSFNSPLVLDVRAGVISANQPIIQFEATGNDNQLWWLEPFGIPDRVGFVYWIHPKNSQLTLATTFDDRRVRLLNVRDITTICWLQAGW